MKPAAPSPAWARVRILLNLGDLPGATDAATKALRGMSQRHRSYLGNARIYGNPDIPVGWVYLNPRARTAVLNLDIWQAHTCHPAMHRFCDQVTSLPLPVFAAYDPVSWAVDDALTRIIHLES